MFQFKDYDINIDMVVVIIAACLLSLIILLIVFVIKQNKLKKRYFAFMKGKDGASLEKAFVNKFENMDKIISVLEKMNHRLNDIDGSLLKTYSKMGIVKYDAFKEVGGTLSFVLALLTKENNGFLINSMHSNREGCFTFIKEVKAGEVFVALSDEENQALQEAVNK